MYVDITILLPQAQSYDITRLSPYQLVTVTITATNGGGTSDPSNEVSGRSSEAGKLYRTSTNTTDNDFIHINIAPGIVDQFNVNQATVTWSPPPQPNGIITGYQVIYSVYQIPSTKVMSDVLDNTTDEFFIEDLSK